MLLTCLMLYLQGIILALSQGPECLSELKYNSTARNVRYMVLHARYYGKKVASGTTYLVLMMLLLSPILGWAVGRLLPRPHFRMI